MSKDLTYTQNFRSSVIENFVNNFSIVRVDAEQLLSLLEKDGIIRLESPLKDEQPVEVLISKGQALGELKTITRKFGNLFLNTQSDWKRTVVKVGELCTSLVGIASGNILAFWVGIFTATFSASELIEIELNENKTAIIMALQSYSDYQLYKATEESCFRDANQILSGYGYNAMSKQEFDAEVRKLCCYKCIDVTDGSLSLIETVSTKF